MALIAGHTAEPVCVFSLRSMYTILGDETFSFSIFSSLQLDTGLTGTDKPARPNLDEDKSVALLKCAWAPPNSHSCTMSLSGLLARFAFFLE